MVLEYSYGFTVRRGGWDRPVNEWERGELDAKAVTMTDGTRFEVGADGVQAVVFVGDGPDDPGRYVEVGSDSSAFAVEADEIKRVEF